MKGPFSWRPHLPHSPGPGGNVRASVCPACARCQGRWESSLAFPAARQVRGDQEPEEEPVTCLLNPARRTPRRSARRGPSAGSSGSWDFTKRMKLSVTEGSQSTFGPVSSKFYKPFLFGLEMIKSILWFLLHF